MKSVLVVVVVVMVDPPPRVSPPGVKYDPKVLGNGLATALGVVTPFEIYWCNTRDANAAPHLGYVRQGLRVRSSVLELSV